MMKMRQSPYKEPDGEVPVSVKIMSLRNYRSQRRRQRQMLGIATNLSWVGLVFWLTINPVNKLWAWPFNHRLAFQQAVNNATSAAELTQSARLSEEWYTVATLWQAAINSMQEVPESSSSYTMAQEKVVEYQRNLAYAQGKVFEKFDGTEAFKNFWTLGSQKEDILRIQGTPTQMSTYEALCRESLHYGDSTVKLSYGIAMEYDNPDSNLRVILNLPTTADSNHLKRAWNLGATLEQVFEIQGIPTRVNHSEFSGQKTLYYGDSSVEVRDDVVIGYDNAGQNLKVRLRLPPAPDPQLTEAFWNLGSKREDVLKSQGTPTQISQQNSMCKEILHYDSSTVELRNGVVVGYDNFGKNLKIK
ncbi:MAG: hypothetical protein F6K19_09140 [Cyanothece sp. SIO1E1]|nr:hypothetical protein [Cyanothece sp. SIO1E1]